jgi:hypothetical protein
MVVPGSSILKHNARIAKNNIRTTFMFFMLLIFVLADLSAMKPVNNC